MGTERLGALDASFIQVERQGLPMHVAGLMFLDSASRSRGPIQPAELRRRLRQRLPDLPRLRTRLAEAPLGLGRPAWVPDDHFDLDRHVERFVLAPGGGWRDLLRLAGELHGRLLPRDRPLWRVALIDGLPQGQQALMTTTHHAATDGIAGVEVAHAIFDHPSSQPAGPAARPNGLFGAAGNAGGPARVLQAAMGAARYLAGGPVAVPGPFNGPVGPRRALATADLRLEDAVGIKEQLGGTVDDVLLASVALALGRHLQQAGVRTEGLRLRAMVPVSMRAGGNGLGNRVTATFLDLPVDLPPVRCLHHVAAAKALGRTWHEPLGLHVALEAAGLAPPLLAAPVIWMLCSLPFANLIVSDIPGPEEPLSLLGARLTAAYPLMPLAASVGLSIGVLRIGRAMGVGIMTDPDLVPGGEQLAQEVGEAFAELQGAARHGRRRRT